MSIFSHLQLQPIESHDDEIVGELNQLDEFETIDLSSDEDGDTLASGWDAIMQDIHEAPRKR